MPNANMSFYYVIDGELVNARYDISFATVSLFDLIISSRILVVLSSPKGRSYAQSPSSSKPILVLSALKPK